MSHSFKVSLVIPIWNSERHLAECLDSVVEQTIFDSTQVILVEDGSEDRSREIAASYALTHENFEILTQPNLGPGAARNNGLKRAMAPFVAFLDADDLLPPRSLETRVTAMERTSADLVVGNLEIFPDERRRSNTVAFAEDTSIANVSELPLLLDNASVCNKLFRASFFRDAQNLFVEGARFEDASVSMRALLDAKGITVLSETCYLYRKEPDSGSIMSRVFDRPANYWDHLSLNEMLLRQYEGDPASLRLLDRFVIRSIRGFLSQAPGTLPDEELHAFFVRARDLYKRYSNEDVADYLTSLGWKISFYALLAGDFDLFSGPMTAFAGVVTSKDGLFLALDRAVDPEFGDLLRIETSMIHQLGEPAFTVVSVEPNSSGSAIRLAGRVALGGGSNLPIPPIGMDFVLGAGSQAPGIRVEITPSPDDPRSGKWEIDLPLEPLSPGDHLLAFRSGVWDASKRFGVSSVGGTRELCKLTRGSVTISVAALDKKGRLGVRVTSVQAVESRSLPRRIGRRLLRGRR